MSGLPDIDVDDWEKNTEYTGYDENNQTIKVGLVILIWCSEHVESVAFIFSGSGKLWEAMRGKN